MCLRRDEIPKRRGDISGVQTVDQGDDFYFQRWFRWVCEVPQRVDFCLGIGDGDGDLPQKYNLLIDKIRDALSAPP
jgi:hypothetical protein